MGIFINPNAIQDNSMAKDKLNTSLQTEIDNKQEALTLTVKDNGNIVLANIQGQSKEFMPATPSGDPMHYAYVAAGAEYNDTGADIVKDAPWADMLDDDYDGDYGKTVIHKAGYWYLNGLGDIDNNEIRYIYSKSSNFPESNDLQERLRSINIRTNFSVRGIEGGYSAKNINAICTNNTTFVVFNGNIQNINAIGSAFNGCKNLVHIIGIIGIAGVSTSLNDIFSNATLLKTVKISNIRSSIVVLSPNLSVKSILFMINNEAATSPITITLYADVYNRCMANADILAALQAHPNISLASA